MRLSSIGYGGTAFDMGCPLAGQSAHWTCTVGPSVTFKDNIVMSIGSNQAGGFYITGYPSDPSGSLSNPFLNAGSTSDHNIHYNMKSNYGTGGCPDVTQETNYICSDPKFQAEASADYFNPQLASGSPAIGAGVAISGLTTD